MHLDRLSFVLYNSLHTQSHSRLHCVTCSPRCNLLYSSSNSTGAQGYRVKCVYGETNDSQTLVTSSNRKLWKVSVAGNDVTMVYASFLEEMQNTLFASFEKVEDYPMPQLFASAQSEKKAARIESWCYKCPKFRKIRLTYLDAGLAAQVFNAVWYPVTSLELPILGVDFLSFGEKNILCVMDFQPLKMEQSYIDKYIGPLHPIRERYADLTGRMSSRFYDENRFFSKELLFGRFQSTKPVYERLFPAFQEYLELYIQLAKQTVEDDNSRPIIWKLQCEYDSYSAEKDPAMSLFRSYFGTSWARRFVYEFLFENSCTTQEDKN